LRGCVAGPEWAAIPSFKEGDTRERHVQCKYIVEKKAVNLKLKLLN
jgi:hypothetical protein